MSVIERRQLMGQAIEAVFVARGAGTVHDRTFVCPRGGVPIDLPTRGPNRGRMTRFDPKAHRTVVYTRPATEPLVGATLVSGMSLRSFSCSEQDSPGPLPTSSYTRAGVLSCVKSTRPVVGCTGHPNDPAVGLGNRCTPQPQPEHPMDRLIRGHRVAHSAATSFLALVLRDLATENTRRPDSAILGCPGALLWLRGRRTGCSSPPSTVPACLAAGILSRPIRCIGLDLQLDPADASTSPLLQEFRITAGAAAVVFLLVFFQRQFAGVDLPRDVLKMCVVPECSVRGRSTGRFYVRREQVLYANFTDPCGLWLTPPKTPTGPDAKTSADPTPACEADRRPVRRPLDP